MAALASNDYLKEYIRLVRRFPLAPIRTDEQLERAHELLRDLMERERGPAESDYMDILIDLIECFEDERWPDWDEEGEPRLLLKDLMSQQNLTIAELARQVGCERPNLSAYLGGRRGLSKVVALQLAERFRLQSDTFLK